MLLRKLLIVFTLLLSFGLSAQNGSKKPHYTIINPGFEPFLNYEKALTHTEFDGLRFLNQRRQIPIEDTKIIIELYSAEELQQKYGKQISPLTVKSDVNAKKVKFKLVENNYKMVAVPFDAQ